MNTRRNSCLVDPRINQQFQIDYMTHYKHYFEYLFRLIEKQETKKAVIIQDFDKIQLQSKPDPFNDGEDKNQYNGDKEKEKNQIQLRLKLAYKEICRKQLQIYRLFDESESILQQMLGLVQAKTNEFRDLVINFNKQKKSENKIFLLGKSSQEMSLTVNFVQECRQKLIQSKQLKKSSITAKQFIQNATFPVNTNQFSQLILNFNAFLDQKPQIPDKKAEKEVKPDFQQSNQNFYLKLQEKNKRKRTNLRRNSAKTLIQLSQSTDSMFEGQKITQENQNSQIQSQKQPKKPNNKIGKSNNSQRLKIKTTKQTILIDDD